VVGYQHFGQHIGSMDQGIQNEFSGIGYHVADHRIRIRECGLDYSCSKCLVMGCCDHGNDLWRSVKIGRFLQNWMTVGLSIRTPVPAFSSSFFNDTCDGLDDLYLVEMYDHTVATGGSPIDLFACLPQPSTLSLHRASSSKASILFIRMLLQIHTWFFYKDKCFGLAERSTEGWSGFQYSNASLMSVRSPLPPMEWCDN
jgi:hypothetical protein